MYIYQVYIYMYHSVRICKDRMGGRIKAQAVLTLTDRVLWVLARVSSQNVLMKPVLTCHADCRRVPSEAVALTR